MKLKVQAQHLQPSDVVDSGERVMGVLCNSIHLPKGKVLVELLKVKDRAVYWGKHTMINVEREEKV